MKQLLQKLIDKGFTEQEAYNILREAYYTGAKNTSRIDDDEDWREDYETIDFHAIIYGRKAAFLKELGEYVEQFRKGWKLETDDPFNSTNPRVQDLLEEFATHQGYDGVGHMQDCVWDEETE